jgi:hypothetical protein
MRCEHIPHDTPHARPRLPANLLRYYLPSGTVPLRVLPTQAGENAIAGSDGMSVDANYGSQPWDARVNIGNTRSGIIHHVLAPEWSNGG